MDSTVTAGDIGVYRPSSGLWWGLLQARTTPPRRALSGGEHRHPVPGDYDGDGKTDVACIDRAARGILNRAQLHNDSSGFNGGSSYIRSPATTMAMGRPTSPCFDSNGTWYITQHAIHPVGLCVGQQRDRSCPGDYDGDGRTDVDLTSPLTGTGLNPHAGHAAARRVSVGRAPTFRSQATTMATEKSDVAVIDRTRPGISSTSSTGFTAWPYGVQWGTARKCSPGRLRWRRKTDIAVYRPSTGCGSSSRPARASGGSGLRVWEAPTYPCGKVNTP